MSGTVARPASTVMLVRDGTLGLEVFTLDRVATMAFAGGMTVFPGGSLDPADAETPLPWCGPTEKWWAGALNIAAEPARQHVVAAVRELFEETGVLLAGGEDLGRDGAVASLRAGLVAHQSSFAAVLRGLAAPLRADLLRPWARWITPAASPRRYDTFFFLAALPPGQSADFATTEATHGGWRRPGEVLAAAEAGDVALMPPTVAMLTDLAELGSVAASLDARRAIDPVTPEVVRSTGEVLEVRAAGRKYTLRLAGARTAANPDRGSDTGETRDLTEARAAAGTGGALRGAAPMRGR